MGKPTVRTAAPKDLERIELASQDELRALQLERLEWSLRHAYDHVPHFRKKCELQEVSPADVRALDDLAKFPFMTKEDLRSQYPFGLFAVPREQVLRLHASSGRTGKPTLVGYTARGLSEVIGPEGPGPGPSTFKSRGLPI